MQRREFLQLSALATAALSLPLSGLQKLMAAQTKQQPTASWRLHANGSFDLISESLRFLNCYLAFDGLAVKPKSVEVIKHHNGGQINYQLSEGHLELTLGTDENSLWIKTVLRAFKQTPHWLYPLAEAEIVGADRYFKQGIGFAGPSGVFPLKEPVKRRDNMSEDVWSWDSYMTAGFMASNDHTLAVGAYKHHDYLQRSTYYNRQHRFGLIDRHLNDNINLFEAGFATEGIKPGEELELPALHIIIGQLPYATFEALAANISKVQKARVGHKPRYHWCSWYEYKEDFSDTHLDELLKGLEGIKPPVPLQTIQIDDGYSEWGDWIIDNDRFGNSGGIKAAFERISKAGYASGIWVGPFMVSDKSKFYKKHPDWMLHDVDGRPIIGMKKSDRNIFMLDTSNPQALEHLRKVFRTLRQWGATYFKTDFMDWGLQDSTKVKRHTPGKTSTQYFVDVLKMIREEIGEESYWLACISPFQPMIGFADAVRVSNDIWSWSKGSALNVIEEMTACQYFNHLLFQTDPDVSHLRHYDTKFNDTQTETLALFNGIMGGIVNTSDRFHKLRPDRLKLWRFIQPGETAQKATLPFWDKQENLYVAVREYDNDSWGILFVNPEDNEFSTSYTLSDLIDKEEGWLFDWQPGAAKALKQSQTIKISLPPHASRLFYVSQNNTPPPKDMAISGRRVAGLD